MLLQFYKVFGKTQGKNIVKQRWLYLRLRVALESFFSSSDLSAREFSSSSLSSLLMSELLEECVERAIPPGRPRDKHKCEVSILSTKAFQFQGTGLIITFSFQERGF